MKQSYSLETLLSRRWSGYICAHCRYERQFHATSATAVRERPHRRVQAVKPASRQSTSAEALSPVSPSRKPLDRVQQSLWSKDTLPEPITSARSFPRRATDKRSAPSQLQTQRSQKSLQKEDTLPKPITTARTFPTTTAKERNAPVLPQVQPSPKRSRHEDTPAKHQLHKPTITSVSHLPNAQPTAFSALASITPAVPTHNAFTPYILAPPPTPPQLSYANRFFTSSKPTFLFGSAKFRTLPPSSLPEVAFLGRSNVGKSSLLNALLHRTGIKVAHVSGKPGRTRQMNAFGVGGDAAAGGGVRVVKTRLEAREGEGTGREVEKWVGRGGLVVLDMPGYGKASREEWGREIVKYLVGRKQLRRAFILIDAEHGPKPTDMQLLTLLRTHSIAYTVVLSKIDKLLFPGNSTSTATLAKHVAKLPEICRRVRQRLEQDDGYTGRGEEGGGWRGGAEGLTKKRQADATAALALTADVLTASAEKAWPLGSGRKIGVENLRWAVLGAAGLDCDEDGYRRVMRLEAEHWDDEDEHASTASTSSGRMRFV